MELDNCVSTGAIKNKQPSVIRIWMGQKNDASTPIAMKKSPFLKIYVRTLRLEEFTWHIMREAVMPFRNKNSAAKASVMRSKLTTDNVLSLPVKPTERLKQITTHTEIA